MTDESLRTRVMRIAEKNSICINRQLSETEYESEVWPLANKAVDEIMALIAEIEREVCIDELEKLRRLSWYTTETGPKFQRIIDTRLEELNNA